MAGIWQTATFAPLMADLSSRNLRLLWTTLPIIGIMLLGAAIIEAVRRWRNRPAAFRFTASDELAHFRSLYEEGELSEEEFHRLQTVLGERIKKELDLPAAPAAAPQSAAMPSTTTGTEAPPLPTNGVPPSANGASPDNLREPPGPQSPANR
jgi:hypothetical protein